MTTSPGFPGSFNPPPNTVGPGEFVLKGTINVNTDFPLAAEVQPGWFYIVRATGGVTDDAGDPYTNTGESFQLGDGIVWDGTDWAGPVDARQVGFSSTGLAATNVQDAVDEVQSQVTAAEADVVTLQGDMTTVQGVAAGAAADIVTLQGDMTTVQGVAAGAAADIVAVKKVLQAPLFQISEYVNNTFEIAIANGHAQLAICAQAANIKPSITGTGAGFCYSITVEIDNTSGGDRTFDWTAISSPKWLGDAPTTLSTGKSGLLTIYTVGTTIWLAWKEEA